jgi:hypothetical protein
VTRSVLFAVLLAAGAASATPNQSNPAFLGIGLGSGGVKGCVVQSVMRGGAAAEAGLEAADVILAIELIPLDDKSPCDQLMNIITAHQPGDRIRLDVMRGTAKLVQHATLTTRAEVLQRRVGERLDPMEVVDVDDAKRHYEIGDRRNRTTVIGWFNAERCVGCSIVFDRVSDGLAKRGSTAALLLAVTPHPLSDNVANLRRVFSSSVPLAIADNDTYGAMASLEDNKRVFFMVVDCRGIIRLVAPLAADSDDLDASVDDLLAAVEQSEHARARR